MKIRYSTVCSGIEGVSVAWDKMGFVPVFFSEIDAFPKAVLAHHYPTVPDLGDLTLIDGKAWKDTTDVFWGSTPCQSASVAGKRAGLNDPRGKLTPKFCELADEIDPKVICWENVKGALTVDAGKFFGQLLGMLSGESSPLQPSGEKWTNAGYVLGPKRIVAWRLFNAEYSGVAQRRERVFVIASPRDSGIDPRQILFENGSGQKVSRPSRSIAQTLEETSGSDATQGTSRRAYALAIRGRDGGEQMEIGDQVANCLRTIKGYSSKAFVLIEGEQPVARQLTPLEAERVMGFPSVSDTINIVCSLNHQKICVNAEIKKRKVPKNVSNAKELPKELNLPVSNVETLDYVNQRKIEKLVVQSVCVKIDDKTAELHLTTSKKESAKIVIKLNMSHRHMLLDVFVPLSAKMRLCGDQKVLNGKEASHQSVKISTTQRNGNSFVKKFGHETEQHAVVAQKNTPEMNQHTTSIISEVGQNSHYSALISQTSYCYAVNAILGCIPKEIFLENSLYINIDYEVGWTDVPFGNGRATDDQRYTALGNSLAIPDVEFIGRQIKTAFENLV